MSVWVSGQDGEGVGARPSPRGRGQHFPVKTDEAKGQRHRSETHLPGQESSAGPVSRLHLMGVLYRRQRVPTQRRRLAVTDSVCCSELTPGKAAGQELRTRSPTPGPPSSQHPQLPAPPVPACLLAQLHARLEVPRWRNGRTDSLWRRVQVCMFCQKTQFAS